MIRRSSAAVGVAVVAMLLILAAPVAAGGWAEIEADAQTTTPPLEGTPIVVGFTVLQHGETPAPWETPTVQFSDLASGARIDVVATNDRADGHFVASVTLPRAGYWTWQVTLKDLASDHAAVPLTVRTASGAMPALDPAAMLTAIDRASRATRQTLGNQFLPEIERLENQLRAERSRTDRLVSVTSQLGDEREALEARVAAAEGAGGLPILAILSVAVLAGAAAGFAMAWLAGRPAPKVATISPAPRGVDPV
jgi:hypothetical protein